MGIRVEVVKELLELKAVRKQGRAHARHMERELQLWLAALLRLTVFFNKSEA